jgi:hypothetical protein
MKNQPKPDYQSSDDVQTPRPLAGALAAHFRPEPACHVHEPCAGEGNFIKVLMKEARCAHSLLLRRGRDDAAALL